MSIQSLPNALLAPLRWWFTRSNGTTRRSRRRAAIGVECLESRSLPDASGLSGKLMVQLKPGAALPPDQWGLTANRVRATPLPSWYEITGPNLDAAAQRLQLDPRVARAALSPIASIISTPNDPSFVDNSLWNLNGPFGIGAPAAWDVNTGSAKVAVGVVDSGIDVAHPDLYKNIWINQAEVPASVKSTITAAANWDVDGDGLITFWDLNDPRNQGAGKITDLDADGKITAKDILLPAAQGGWSNGVSDDGDSYVDDLIGWNFVDNNNKPFDDLAHGTFVAGAIGAIGNNGVGVAGINWKVQLMPLKFIDALGEGFESDGSMSIVYAADHGARVSNNSWVGDPGDPVLLAALAAAAAKDHLVVGGVGNDGVSTDSSPLGPASVPEPNVIAVAASDRAGNLASFSNYGAVSVDLAAPGIDIVSTMPGGGYASFFGTSFSTPHVAGAAALVLAQAPGLSAVQVKELILSRVTPNASLAGKTVSGGILNVGSIFTGGPEIQITSGAVSLADNANTVDFGVSTMGTPTSKLFRITNVGIEPLTLGTLALPAGFAVVFGPTATTLAPGRSASLVVRMTATAKGAFSGQLTLANSDASESAFRVTLRGMVANRPPVVAPLADQTMPFTQATLTAPVTANDPDGDPVTLSATAVSQHYYYKQLFRLFTNGNLHQDFAGQQEKWLYGHFGAAFFILPSGDLFRYVGPDVRDGTFIANVGMAAYQDPSLLYNAAFASAPAAVAGGVVTVDPVPNFAGKLVVTVTASDGALSGAESFTLTVTNEPPALAPIMNQSMPASQKVLKVPFSASDPEGQPLSITATIATEAYSLKQQYGLFLNGSLFTNQFGRQEKWLYGSGGQAFFILPSGAFFKWNGTPGVATGVFLAGFDPKYYQDPSLLYKPVNNGGSVDVANGQIAVSHAANFVGHLVVTVALSDGVNTSAASFKVSVINQAPILSPIADQSMPGRQAALKIALHASDPDRQTLTYAATAVPLTYGIQQRYGISSTGNYDTNRWGAQEKWLDGTGGTSFYLLPTGEFYEWNGTPNTVAGTLVAIFDPTVYQDPTLLTKAANAGVSSSVSGNRLLIDPAASYRGKILVTAMVSDGWASASRTFVVSVV